MLGTSILFKVVVARHKLDSFFPHDVRDSAITRRITIVQNSLTHPDVFLRLVHCWSYRDKNQEKPHYVFFYVVLLHEGEGYLCTLARKS